MGNDLVSVIIPAYNAQRWLRDAIDSALQQTWPSIEVLVVDDGSKDDSVGIARSYGESVRVLEAQENGGPAVARNRGLQAARGEWIQFLDADDRLLPEKVERCIAAVEGPSDVPFCKTEIILEAGFRNYGWWRRSATRWLRIRTPEFDENEPLLAALTGWAHTNELLHRKSILKALGGFNTQMRWQEDTELKVRLALHGIRFRRVDEVLVHMREHTSAGRQRLHPDAMQKLVHNEVLILERIRSAGQLSPRVSSVMSHRLAWAGRQAWRAGNVALGQEAFTLARSLHPRPNVTGYPAYNLMANWVGLERFERMVDRLIGVR